MPTYESIGDHTEALRVYYDPAVVSYDELLKKFWAEHDPMPMEFTGFQYRSAVWYHDGTQLAAVEHKLGGGGSPFASKASMHEKRSTRSGTLGLPNAAHAFAASPESGKPVTAHVPGVPFLAAITSHTTTAALRPLSLFSLDPAWPSSSRRLFTPDTDQVFPEASRSRPVTVVCQWAVTSSPASARKPSQIA